MSDAVNDGIQKLVDAVQKASPVVWQAAYRQVWIDGIESVLAVVFLIGLARYLWKCRASALKHEDWSEPVPVFSAIGAFIVALIAVGFVFNACDCFLNPTFQAIRNLKGLL